MKLFPDPGETISALSLQIRSGERSSLEIIEGCLQRITQWESKVRAWVLIDREDARAQARRLDAEVSNGRWRGPLHGIPVGIKDIVDVAGWPTVAGSPALKDNIAVEDATVVARLRDAGAVILGKTVTTQHAAFDPPVTRNPWNLARTPGGSSSGSAAAVATGMCLAAIGSQTGGSITRPAAYCGVASCKPSFGRVSLRGIMPMAPGFDHPGPFARSVRDVAIMLEAIAGPDPEDPYCTTAPSPKFADQMESETPAAPRLGRLANIFTELADSAVRTATEMAFATFGAAGAYISQVTLPPSFRGVCERHQKVLAAGTASVHQERFAQHPEDFAPAVSALIEEGLNVSVTEYIRCREQQLRLCREMLDCFDQADVLVCPAATCPAPDASTTGDPSFSFPWSHTGLPVVSIPIGLDADGLPLAVQLVGRPWGELELLQAALWCEQALATAA